jgi:hypothetical protein
LTPLGTAADNRWMMISMPNSEGNPCNTMS